MIDLPVFLRYREIGDGGFAMIEKLTLVEGTKISPYENLALEEYLLFQCLEEECILFLWQNEKTVVIGKNQNAWKECFVSRLEEDGVNLVRRISGGGAVYHDLGNLNFTFITRSNHFDVERQMRVIVNAIRNMGICADCSGRNDVLVDGKKISGNAYCRQGEFCYHHGTIMIDVDVWKLSRYLNVPEDKLKSKGVDSVRSRVGNLKDFLPEITIREVKDQILNAFQEGYGKEIHSLDNHRIMQEQIADLERKYLSWEWTYGKKFEFQQEISRRFFWGSVSILFKISEGRIEEVEIYSDAMEVDCLADIKGCLRGIPYSKKKICSGIALCGASDELEEKIVKDIISWIEKEDIG